MKKSYLDQRVELELNGDKSRVAELFFSDADLMKMNKNSNDNDWYFFESNSYDGDYLVKDGEGYVCYYQERGRALSVKRFNVLKDAAQYMFKSTGYTKK